MLCDYVIARHYPEASGPREMLDRVIAAQGRLIARWMCIGFIHGVMNTDNMSIAGETIDYGPCAFMDAYDPEKKFSSIDEMGYVMPTSTSRAWRIGIWCGWRRR